MLIGQFVEHDTPFLTVRDESVLAQQTQLVTGCRFGNPSDDAEVANAQLGRRQGRKDTQTCGIGHSLKEGAGTLNTGGIWDCLLGAGHRFRVQVLNFATVFGELENRHGSSLADDRFRSVIEQTVQDKSKP